MKRKRGMSVLLAAALTAAALSGCTKTEGKEGAGDDAIQNIEADETQETDGEASAQETGSEATGTVAASAAAEGTSAAIAGGQTAMGRYMETEIPLPEDMLQLNDIRVLADGTLRVLGFTTETMGVWDSRDDGASWSQPYTFLDSYADGYINCGAIAEDGSVFCCISDDTEDNIYLVVTSDGQCEEVTLAIPEKDLRDGNQDFVYWVRYAQEGEWLVKAIADEHIYLIDGASGEILRTYNEDEDYIAFWWKLDDRIFAAENEAIVCFDYESGEEIEMEAAWKEELESRKENLYITTSNAYPLLVCTGEDGAYYYCNTEGIYRFAKGGTVIEKLADGSLNSLSKPSIQLTYMLVLADGSIYVTVIDDSEPRILRYRYNAEAPTVPDTELKVYAMENNVEVQQAISMFQNEHPEYYVNLEIGMTGDDAVTASDALRTLNTEIMAGSGPDILILDGMPLASYIEKGILEDISDLVAETEENDGIFSQIAKAYESDGAVYAVPSRFQIPILMADEETLEQVKDLASLTTVAAELRDSDGEMEQIMSVSNIYYLVYKLYCAYSTGLLSEDGGIDKEALSEFLADAKQIFDLNYYEEEYEEFYYSTYGDEDYDMSTVSSAASFLAKTVKMEQVNLASTLVLATAAMLEEDAGIGYSLTSPDSHIFVPKAIVGINSRSTQIEGAKEFVAFLLSQKAQATNQGTGFPVNRAAFEENLADEKSMSLSTSYTFKNEDGIEQMIEYQTHAPSEEQLDVFWEQVESLDTPCLTDAVMQELVIDQACSYVAGEVSLEEAVNTIEQKMNLYLAE